MEEPGNRADTWFSGELTHEGLPLLLRFPSRPDVESLKDAFPWLVNVTHRLASVTDRGLPEKNYNRTLEDFDVAIVGALKEMGQGLTVLVETFDCLRNYYCYTANEAAIDQFQQRITRDYPEHELEWFRKLDKNWNFFRRYSTDCNFYPDFADEGSKPISNEED
ncbi:MAG: DUF695 domain-containing protein [Planctomycetes bacterium]|nr:DUF695 domain-containing protein [Planctomycetota bacterium]